MNRDDRHPFCAHPIRPNKWRKDAPAKLLSSYKAIQRLLPRQGAH